MLTGNRLGNKLARKIFFKFLAIDLFYCRKFDFMIKEKSISKEWIEHVAKSGKADKIFVEKTIMALILLEGLAVSDLDFRFKGGTALMLLLPSGKRMSIDIDIVVADKSPDLSRIVDAISHYKGFSRYEKQERKAGSTIDKEHYILFFQSVIEKKESYVLLDVLKKNTLRKYH
jgi:hypothetical protein